MEEQKYNCKAALWSPLNIKHIEIHNRSFPVCITREMLVEKTKFEPSMNYCPSCGYNICNVKKLAEELAGNIRR